MIFVFKTSVNTKTQIKKLKPHIDKIAAKENLNFDLEDCDRILRVDCDENPVVKIVDLLNIYKFSCEELE